VGSTLPEIEAEAFLEAMKQRSPRALAEGSLEALRVHYQELRRWNPTLSLVGPAAAEDVLSRHFGESLAALDLLPEAVPGGGAVEVVDVGSGGGFPGLVLAASAPGLSVTLVEARQRKSVFLETVARKATLPCRCLNARVSRPLPRGLPSRIDVVTVRALRLPRPVMAALAATMAPEGRFLLWQTEPFDEPPPGFSAGRTIWFPESERRSVTEYLRDEPGRRGAVASSPGRVKEAK
jgi:16S rRNA (guanine(527)-N(7))-methyltransferase RsmG